MTFQLNIIRQLRREMAEEGERLSLWLPVFLAIGIGLYFSLGHEPPAALMVAAGLLVVALIFLGRFWASYDVYAFAVATIVLGMVVSSWSTMRAAAAILEQPGWYDLSGRIIAINQHGKGMRLLLDQVQLRSLPAAQTPVLIRVRVSSAAAPFGVGDRLQGRGLLRPPPPPVMPGAFDFQRNAYFKKIGAIGVLIGTPEITAAAAATDWLTIIKLTIEDWRVTAAARIDEHLSASPSAAVAAALLVGKRGAVSTQTWDRIRAAGLAHLLAISGLHMGMVTGFVFFFLRALMAMWPRLALNCDIKKIAGFGALLCAVLYLALSGAAPPAERAFVIVLLALLGVMTDRLALSMRSLALAASLLLVISPEILLGPSFQMSFAAATVLVALYESPQSLKLRRRQSAGRGPLWWRTLIWVCWYFLLLALSSLAASLATAPFVGYHFHEVSMVGVLANLIAVPLAALWVMPAGVVVLIAMPFGLEALPLTLMGFGIDGILLLAETVAAWPHALLRLGALGAGGVIMFTLGGLWLLLWTRRQRFLGIPVAALGLLWAAAAPPPDILVSGDGRLAAVRLTGTQHAIAVSSATAGRFSREKWRQALGMEPADVRRFKTAGEVIDCDNLGCVFRADNTLIGFSDNPAGHDDDCRQLDILISPTFPVWQSCERPILVLDSRDLSRAGAHAIWLNKGEFIVRSVAGERGRRPWTRRDR